MTVKNSKWCRPTANLDITLEVPEKDASLFMRIREMLILDVTRFCVAIYINKHVRSMHFVLLFYSN